jgi:hypothetical protein
MTEAHSEVVLGFASKAVYLTKTEAGYNVVVPNGYTSPYTAAYADGVLTISAVEGADVADLLAIVIDGKVYTKGFSASEGAISITLEVVTPPVEEIPPVEEPPVEE